LLSISTASFSEFRIERFTNVCDVLFVGEVFAFPLGVSTFCESSDLDCEAQRHNNKRFVAIAAHNQEVMVPEPVVELAKSVGASPHFNSAIDAEERNRNIATKSTTRSAAQRNPFGGESGTLQRANDGAFSPIALLP
jgi:hypothetical protein